MLGRATAYVIHRGVTDAEVLSDGLPRALEERWATIAPEVEQGRKGVLKTLCTDVDGEIAKCPENDPAHDDVFVTPHRLAQRTRLGLAVVDEIEKRQLAGCLRNGLTDIVQISKVVGATVEEVRDALAGIFIVPEPSLDNVLVLCKKEEGPTVEIEDPNDIKEVLDFSIRHGRPPDGQEAAELVPGKSAARLKKEVQRFLVSDIQALIVRFSRAGFVINDVVLNRYSPYFREYGFRIYELWFDEDPELFYRQFGDESATVKKLLDRDNSLQRLKSNVARSLYKTPQSLPSQFPEVEDDDEVIRMIEAHYEIRLGYQTRERFNRDSTRRLLSYFQEHDLCFTPPETWFVYGAPKMDELLCYYDELQAMLEEFHLPLKTKIRFLRKGFYRQDINDYRETIRSQIAFFERHGLSFDYYLPYLGVYGEGDLALMAHRIIGTVCVERRMLSTPSPKNKKRPEEITNATQDRVEALLYLNKVFKPYDETSRHTQDIGGPEALARRARLLEGLPIALDEDKLTTPMNTLRERMPAYALGRYRISYSVDDIQPGDYESMIAERRLVPPAWAVTSSKDKIKMVRRIRYIESRGILFTAENIKKGIVAWSWIQRGKVALDRAMVEKKRNAYTKDELLTSYGIDWTGLPVQIQQTKNPDRFWRYLRVLHEVDMTIVDIPPSWIGQHRLEFFRDKVAYLLRRKKESREKLTPKQQLFLDQYDLADTLHSDRGWSDAYDLCVLLSRSEMGELQAVGSKKSELLRWHTCLQERAQQKEAAIKQLLGAEIPYLDADTLLDKVPPDQLIERMAALKQANKSIDAASLRRKSA